MVVGASAGGFQGVAALLRSLPVDFPAAVCIVVHRGPDGPAMLPTLFGGLTALPIRVPNEPEELRPGHVYLAPLDCHLVLSHSSVLSVRGPREHGFRPAVDPLFLSAAEAHGDKVVGVVLSGGLDDGTAGLIAIKKKGGRAIVQNPEEALVPSMPLSAVKNVQVDAVVSASDIGPLLVDLMKPQPGGNLHTRSKRKPTPPKSMEMTGRLTKPVNGTLTAITCPECGGPLWAVNEGRTERFQCHVGHRFGSEALEVLSDHRTENLLWSAVRALREDAELRRRMAERVDKRGLSAIANRWLEEARGSDDRAQHICQLIEKMSGGTTEAIGIASDRTRGPAGRKKTRPAKARRRRSRTIRRNGKS